MKILILAQHYAPEEVSGAILATQLASDLVGRGHDVFFVTAVPSYPLGRPFAGYQNRIFQKELIHGVKVFRTWSYLPAGQSLVGKVLNFGTFSVGAFFGGFGVSRPDVLMSYSPPLPLGVSAWMLSRLMRVPWVLRVEDLYPDAAVNAGVISSPLAIRLLGFVERFLYSKATHLSLISEGFRNNVMQKGVARLKASVIPVWADPSEVVPLPADNGFREEHGLGGKFVVLYAGNMGTTSCLEDVVDAAALCRTEEGIHFLLVGEGVKKPELVKRARAQGLSNVTFLPFQPRARFGEMMAAGDVSLVTLNNESSGTSLPCKTFTGMASGRPLLAVVPDSSEIARLVRDTGCGWVVPPDEPGKLAATICRIMGEPEIRREMGASGRRTVETTYSRKRCVDLFEETLQRVVA